MYTPIEQGLTSPPYTQKTQIRPVSLADSIWFFNEIPLSVPAHNSTAQINGLFHILLLQPGTDALRAALAAVFQGPVIVVSIDTPVRFAMAK